MTLYEGLRPVFFAAVLTAVRRERSTSRSRTGPSSGRSPWCARTFFGTRSHGL